MFYNVGFNNIYMMNNYFSNPFCGCNCFSLPSFPVFNTPSLIDLQAFPPAAPSLFNFNLPVFDVQAFSDMQNRMSFPSNSLPSINFDSNKYMNFSSFSAESYNAFSEHQAVKPAASKVSNFGSFTSPPSRSAKSYSTTSVQDEYTRRYCQLRNPEKLGPEFLAKTKKIAKTINCDYRDLLAVMNCESVGINSKEAHRNSKGKITAVGLIQFTQIAVDQLNKDYKLGLTLDKILKMSAMEQLDLVEKYYISTKRITKFPENKKMTGADLYGLTYLPFKAKNEVLAKKGESNYDSNPSLDFNKDGKITRADLEKLVASRQIRDSRFV